MGLRDLERRFLLQICEQEIRKVVEAYVAKCAQERRISNPAEYLKKPILERGIEPPGMQSAMHCLAGLRPRTPARVIKGDDGFPDRKRRIQLVSKDRVKLPSADKLVRLLFEL